LGYAAGFVWIEGLNSCREFYVMYYTLSAFESMYFSEYNVRCSPRRQNGQVRSGEYPGGRISYPPFVCLRNRLATSPTTTITMEDIETALSSAVSNLSDQNYTESLAFYRFWIDIGQTYHKIPPDLILDTIWKNRATNSIVPTEAKLIHPTAHLILRLASDAESDHVLAPYSLGLQTRLGSRTLREFFADNLRAVRSEGGSEGRLHAEVNFIAHLANLGYVEEAAIRDHILQSLISHPKLHDHQADALIILFKLAGATFGAIADPSVVDRCLELLKAHSYNPPYVSWHETENNNYFRMKKELVQVCTTGKG